MISEDTQIVIIDEWSDMSPNLAKSLLQGGWMVGAVKHKSPRFINNNRSFIITICKIEEWVHLFYLSICLFTYLLGIYLFIY
jgi:hypothetical protein